jgi:hypothetical protein
MSPMLPLIASAFGDSLAPSFASNLLQRDRNDAVLSAQRDASDCLTTLPPRTMIGALWWFALLLHPPDGMLVSRQI